MSDNEDLFSAFEIQDIFSYNIDICIVMDITGSMKRMLYKIRNNVFEMYDQIREEFAYVDKELRKLRVRMVAFKDFAYDGDQALTESRFFNLPEEAKELIEFLDSLETGGGGDRSVSALEALAVAMRSDWLVAGTNDETKVRHVILLFTDAPAAPLNDSSKPEGCVCARIDNPSYPANMPKDMSELSDMWYDLSMELPGMPDQKAKRFILFAPDAEPWNSMIWDNTWYNECRCDHSLSEVEMDMADYNYWKMHMRALILY